MDLRNIGTAFHWDDSEKAALLLEHAGLDPGWGEGNGIVGYEITLPAEQAEAALEFLRGHKDYLSGEAQLFLFDHPMPMGQRPLKEQHDAWLIWRGECMEERRRKPRPDSIDDWKQLQESRRNHPPRDFPDGSC